MRMHIKKPSHELSVGEIISQSFRLYRARFILFFLPFVVAHLISGIFVSVLLWYLPLPSPPPPGASFATITQWFLDFVATWILISAFLGISSAVIGAIATGMAIKCTSDFLEKGSSTIKEGLGFAMSKLVSLAGVSIISGILIIVGLFLFYAPGVIFMIMFSLAVPVVVIERKGVFESLGRSRKLVSHRWGKTFVLLLIIGIAPVAVGWISTVVTNPFGNARWIVSSLITAFVSPIFPIATTFLYYSMIAREVLRLPPPTPPFP